MAARAAGQLLAGGLVARILQVGAGAQVQVAHAGSAASVTPSSSAWLTL